MDPEAPDVNQRALAKAAEELGRLLEEAATAHELDAGDQRATWRRIADAAARVSAYAALLGGDDRPAD